MDAPGLLRDVQHAYDFRAALASVQSSTPSGSCRELEGSIAPAGPRVFPSSSHLGFLFAFEGPDCQTRCTWLLEPDSPLLHNPTLKSEDGEEAVQVQVRTGKALLRAPRGGAQVVLPLSQQA